MRRSRWGRRARLPAGALWAQARAKGKEGRRRQWGIKIRPNMRMKKELFTKNGNSERRYCLQGRKRRIVIDSVDLTVNFGKMTNRPRNKNRIK